MPKLCDDVRDQRILSGTAAIGVLLDPPLPSAVLQRRGVGRKLGYNFGLYNLFELCDSIQLLLRICHQYGLCGFRL